MRGIVKYFNPNKGFGFIQNSDGADFFFHIKGYRIFETKKGSTAFTQAAPKQTPKEEDSVVFVEGVGQKGPKAECWTFVADLKQSRDEDLVIPGTKFRVVRIRVKDGIEDVKTLWKGMRPGALAAKMPRTGDPHTDPLFPRPSETICFQVNSGSGWQERDDFRPLAF